MKWIQFFAAVCLLACLGCGSSERERAYQQKLEALNNREKALNLKESSLQLKEAELTRKEKRLDSTTVTSDSARALPAELAGVWAVSMRCSETSCSGSAIGDLKNEQWEIGSEGNSVVVRAMTGNTLARVYSGTCTGTTLQLTASQEETGPGQLTKIVVNMEQTGKNQMEGQREIIRGEDCRIVYALDLRKQ